MALFKTLFEVKIKHTYYSDDISADFKVVPTQETRQHLQDHGMLFRSTSSGFLVLAEAEQTSAGDHKVRSHPIDPVRYRFFLKLEKPEFLNYTKLPFHQTDKELHYFNNLNANIHEVDLDDDGDKETVKYLHSAERVNNNSRMNFKTGTYSTEIDKKSARLTFIDLDTEDEQKVGDESGKVQFNLQNYPSGRAQLVVDGSVEETFYTDNRRSMAGMFGVIELFHNQAVPNPYRFIESDGKLKKQVYTLKFDRRKTFWKYFVYDRTGQDLSSPDISGEQDGSDYIFQDITPNGSDNPTVLVSPKELPLREYPQDQEKVKPLKLRQKVNGSHKTVMELPNPGVKMLKRDENNTKKYYSEVFIYI